VEHFSPTELIQHGRATDPHLWMDPNLWHKALLEVGQFTARLDPKNANVYLQNWQQYEQTLKATDAEVANILQQVPPTKRVLITSHDAFAYFARRYGWQVESLLGISTESEVSLATIERLVELIVRKNIAAVFSESSLPLGYLASLKQGLAQRNKRLTIGGPLYADSLSASGTAASYQGMLLANSCHIVTAINQMELPQC